MAELFAVVLLLLAGAAARAASFTIDPLKVELSPGQLTSVMRIHNTSSDVLTLQLQPKRWTQDQKADQLEATRDLIATPQIFRIKPGAIQIVRVAKIGKSDTLHELAYRLVFDEIPPPVSADFNGVQIATRVTIPLFVRPSVTTGPQVRVVVKGNDGGKLSIMIINSGTAHAHLRKFIIQARDDQNALLEVEAPAYLLPGSTRDLVFSLPESWSASMKNISIKAINVQGTVEFDGTASP